MLLTIWNKGDYLEIILANSAGFCFGVDRALKKVYDNLGAKHIYTYGPIIHNNYVVNELSDKGVKVIENLDSLSDLPCGKLVIRSHGISEAEEMKMKASGFEIIEATCPYVKRIHKKVKDASRSGKHIIIIGNKDHPEVKGISGWSETPVYIIQTMDEVDNIPKSQDITYEVVAQTTFNIGLYNDIVLRLQNENFRVIINETICYSTKERQEEAFEIAEKADLMIVVGSKHSSNTKKLYEICKRQCENTYHIESIEEFELNVLSGNAIIGITAGASTPKKLIEEVISNVRNAE